ncbi:E3 ubiquitin-protein ligase DCST1 [Aplochiton taeniatus]
MLGSRGRAFVMLMAISGLHRGPISNIYRNVQTVAVSMSCNMELQVNFSRVMWRSTMEPFMQVFQDILDDNKEFQEEARNMSRKFQAMRDELIGQYGYDRFNSSSVADGNSTQDQYTAKTKKRCDHVVEQGMDRCGQWFQSKWEACMATIQAPLINNLLCLSMKFSFLCNILRVMTPWCREQIPVEGNFGQTFDQLNESISAVSREFSTRLAMQSDQQGAVVGLWLLREQYSAALSKAFRMASLQIDALDHLLQLLLSCTFIMLFITAFGYTREYCHDIRFDNVYITTHFRQIDAHRRRDTAGLLQVLSLGVFVGVLLSLDLLLYHIFDIIRRHTYTEFSHSKSHHINIRVGGDSMMAKLLRKTIGAFNTSSNLDMHSTNQHCLPQPTVMSVEDYLDIIIPVLVMALMCCLQVYSNRLRRVIAAFYFPKREKRRVLYLYNLQVQRNISFISRQSRRLHVLGQAHRTAFLGTWRLWSRLGVCWCWGCEERQRAGRAVWCGAPGCQAVFCPRCWRDLARRCPTCCPPSSWDLQDCGSDTELYYGGG